MNTKTEQKRKWFQNPYVYGTVTAAMITAGAIFGLRSCGPKPEPCEPCQKPAYSSCYKPGEDPAKVKKELRCFNPKLESRMELAQVTISPDLPSDFKPCKDGEIVVCEDVTPKPPATHIGKKDTKKDAKKAEQKKGCCNPNNKCEEPQVCNKECKCVEPTLDLCSPTTAGPAAYASRHFDVRDFLNTSAASLQSQIGDERLTAVTALCKANGQAVVISVKGQNDNDALYRKVKATLNASLEGKKFDIVEGQPVVKVNIPIKVF